MVRINNSKIPKSEDVIEFVRDYLEIEQEITSCRLYMALENVSVLDIYEENQTKVVTIDSMTRDNLFNALVHELGLNLPEKIQEIEIELEEESSPLVSCSFFPVIDKE